MTELLEAYAKGNSEEALYYTCLYIKNQKIEELEDAWIEVVSVIGERKEMLHYATWTYINEKLLALLEQDAFRVEIAIEMTAMIMLLYLRVKDNSKNVATQQALRKTIFEHFPEGTLLSYRGQEVFKRILPSANSSTFAFCHRVLAGMCKLIDDGKWDVVRNALEYLYRKKVALPMQNIWPAPNQNEAAKGHPCWFLWGALLCGVNDKHVATNWKLYTWNWRPSLRKTRAGLLVGVVHLGGRSNEVQSIWSAKEEMILNKVRSHALDLWNEVRMKHTPQNVATTHEIEDDEYEGDADPFYALHTFVPRGVQKRDIPRDQSESYGEETTKVIDISRRLKESNSKKSNTTRIKKVSDNHETGDTDSRHRWLDFSPTRF